MFPHRTRLRCVGPPVHEKHSPLWSDVFLQSHEEVCLQVSFCNLHFIKILGCPWTSLFFLKHKNRVSLPNLSRGSQENDALSRFQAVSETDSCSEILHLFSCVFQPWRFRFSPNNHWRIDHAVSGLVSPFTIVRMFVWIKLFAWSRHNRLPVGRVRPLPGSKKVLIPSTMFGVEPNCWIYDVSVSSSLSSQPGSNPRSTQALSDTFSLSTACLCWDTKSIGTWKGEIVSVPDGNQFLPFTSVTCSALPRMLI